MKEKIKVLKKYFKYECIYVLFSDALSTNDIITFTGELV
jgi:hypothetical protein